MGPETDTWPDALTRRLRALIRTAPLHRLEGTKGMRAARLDSQDLRAIALRVLDVVIESMGLGSGATFDDVREVLRPLVLASDSGLDVDRADAITDLVILGMLNDRERRQAFAEPYLAVGVAGTARKELSFHLLRERETPEGDTVLVATVEAVNLYAGMLDYPVEDAQIAEEAVLHAQVQRGRIADAVRTAQRARLRSIEYEQNVVGLIETVRRDVERVDWVRQVLAFLATARQHLRERLDVERVIERAVEERIDQVRDESAASLVALRDALRECIQRHLRLHRRLIEANRHYLAEQERQAFRPPAATRLPDLEADVLQAAVGLATAELAGLVDALLASLQPPAAPRALRISHLVDRLLAPRRNEAEEPLALEDPDLELLALAPRSFAESDRDAVDAFLAGAAWPSRLSTLLEEARAAGLGADALHLLAVRALRAFAPDRADEDGLIAVALGARLEAPGFAGDDLRLERLAEATA